MYDLPKADWIFGGRESEDLIMWSLWEAAHHGERSHDRGSCLVPGNKEIRRQEEFKNLIYLDNLM